MTEKDRQKLINDLRTINSSGRIVANKAADELERLAENQKEDEFGPPLTESEQLVNILRYSEPMYVGRNIRRQAADEIERLSADNERLVLERDAWVRDGEIAWRKVLELSRCITTPQSRR